MHVRIFFDRISDPLEQNVIVEKASAGRVYEKQAENHSFSHFKTRGTLQNIRMFVCVGRPGGGAFAGT
ncbi:MAG TPA: hypothetical protein VIV35_05300 [Chitinophagaceae bacterium]